MKKRVSALIICVCVLAGIILYGTVFRGENDTEMTNKYEGKTVMEKYVFGDYTVELLETRYERKTSMGEAIFRVTKKDGIPEVEIEKDGRTKPIEARRNRFGKNGELGFSLNVPGNLEGYYKLEGSKLFITEKFEGIWNVSGMDEKLGDYLLLVKKYFGEEKKVWIEVTEPETAYEMEEGTLYVSTMGARLYTKHPIPNLHIGIIDNEGKEFTPLDLKNKIGTENYDKADEESDGKTKTIYTIRFDKKISVKDIKNVVVESRQ